MHLEVGDWSSQIKQIHQTALLELKLTVMQMSQFAVRIITHPVIPKE
jgi:hypothetical protein